MAQPPTQSALEVNKAVKRVAELLRVEEAGGYRKEVWAMNEDEKTREVASLRETGNTLFKEKKYSEACDCYGKAIGILEQLMLRLVACLEQLMLRLVAWWEQLKLRLVACLKQLMPVS